MATVKPPVTATQPQSAPALGIRSPGTDGAWGSTLYASASSNNLPVGAALQEDRLRAFYVDPNANPIDSILLSRSRSRFHWPRTGRLVGQNFAFEWPIGQSNDQEPGTARVITENDFGMDRDPAARLVMLDSYGNPIEYFRFHTRRASFYDVRDFLGGPDLPDAPIISPRRWPMYSPPVL